MITNKEKEQLAQHYFNYCFNEWGYSICGIADFYNDVLGGNFHPEKQNEKMTGYKELYAFHIFKPIETSTKVKLMTLTKNCFQQMGYNVEEIEWILK